MEDKFAVAGYDRDRKKLNVMVMTLDEVIYLLKSNRHFDYTPEQIERLKKDLVHPKGHHVDFQTVQFKILKV